MSMLVDAPARLQIPDASMPGPSQSSRSAAGTRPASAQVYPSSTPHSASAHVGSQSSRKRASHTVTSSQNQQEEQQVGYRDVYSHPAAVAYAAAHPRRTIPKFGPYLLLQTLGEGEFGKVKLGLHQQWGEEVAVKLIRRGNIDTQVRMSKVEREIEVLRTLKHPNIVRLYDVIETDKYIGIILEYASGGELFDHILAHRYLKEKDACKLFTQLISGVWYIHQKKIVHRDLKLENLLLDRHRNVIITDFGFANRFEHRSDDLMQTSCGSPCYAAPELVISEGLYVGSAVDIWSCGVILYAMLAGYLPFDDDPANPDGDNINLLYRYIVNTPLTFPDYVSAEARDLLSLMLVPDPTRRADLETIMSHHWLQPYAHLFDRTVQDLERLAMEQHQMKRMAYQRQMKQQAAAAAAEQTKMVRSQSARTEIPPMPGSVSSHRSRHHQYQSPASAIGTGGERYYETNDNPDESLFTSPPPVPVTRGSTRRHVASAVVTPTAQNTFEDDPFGPPPVQKAIVPPSEDEYIGAPEPREPRSHRSRESTGRTPRKQPPAPTVAPVKMSPERRKTDRQRHTIQLEYGGDAQEDIVKPTRSSTPKAQESSFTQPQHPVHQTERQIEAVEAQGPIVIGDAISTEDYVMADATNASSKVSTNGVDSISKASKPLPVPPAANGDGLVTPKSSISNVPEQVQSPINNQIANTPIVSVTPTSPQRSEIAPPPSAYPSDAPRDGSLNSSGSRKSKHGRGMSVDKFVGKIWGSSSDTEGGTHIGSVKVRRPSDASVTPNGTTRTPPDTLNVYNKNGMQVSPDSKSSINTDRSSTKDDKEGKKSRRNTLTIMVEPLTKRISQRKQGRSTSDVPPQTNGRTKKESIIGGAPPVLPKAAAAESDVPATPHFPPSNRAGIPSLIPASTSKASIVMKWFRYRSKSRTPSESGHAEDMADYENVAHPDERSVTPTAENPTPQVNVIEATPARQQANISSPGMGQSKYSLSSDVSVPATPATFIPRSMPRFGRSNGAQASSQGTVRGPGFDIISIRLHHGAVDHTTVTTGSPPDVMTHVTRILLDMGLEVQQESEWKFRCVRAKRKKGSRDSTSTGFAALNLVGSAGSSGVDKRGLPMPSQSGFSSTGGMLKGLLMRRQSSQVSNGSVNHPSTISFSGDSSIDTSREEASRKEVTLPTPPAHEPVYGDRAIDQGDEVRFSVELTRIEGLDGTFSLDIRRLKGNLRSYKFLYDTVRERCDLPRWTSAETEH